MKNYIYYIVSCVLFSLGATSFIFSELGTDPLDVFCLGVQNYVDIKIGTIQSIIALVCLAIYSALDRFRMPPISTFMTFFICGYMIDFFRFLLVAGSTYVSPYVLLGIGILLCVQGSAGIITSGIGVRAMDLLALRLEYLTTKPFWLYKGVAEFILLASGWMLGGPVGIGTIAFLLVVGALIQPTINLNRKVFEK